jgi:hypothetical protein
MIGHFAAFWFAPMCYRARNNGGGMLTNLHAKIHFVKGCLEEDFGLTIIVNEDFYDVPYADVDCDDHGVSVWE